MSRPEAMQLRVDLDSKMPKFETNKGVAETRRKASGEVIQGARPPSYAGLDRRIGHISFAVEQHDDQERRQFLKPGVL